MFIARLIPPNSPLSQICAFHRLYSRFMLLALSAATLAAQADIAPGLFVREVRVSGARAIPEEQFKRLTREYEGRQITPDEIEDLRIKITRLYVDAGYINSGAVIPEPAVKDGVLQIRVVEGTLTAVEISGNRWTRSAWYRQRLRHSGGEPLRVSSLQERLQMFSLDGVISRFDAQLLPGANAGDSTLRVQVQEQFPVHVFVSYDNYQAPAVGEHRGQITAIHQNLTGFGDALSLTYGRSSGISPLIDASYSFPLTRWDTTLNVAYRKNNSLVVEEIFRDLDITSRTDVYTVALRQPFVRRLGREFAAGISFDRSRSETYLLGERFSFSPGAIDGRSTVSVLRLSQEWTTRSQEKVFTARSRFSFGLAVFGATIRGNAGDADSRFFSWIGQTQYAQRLWKDIQVIARTDAQFANDPLPPLEQVPVGGRFSVRGYRENQLVRDNGLIASLEGRLPVSATASPLGRLEVASFVDFGHAWNVAWRSESETASEAGTTIASIGLGLRWNARRAETRGMHPYGEIYWGIPLNRLPNPSGRTSVQDMGLHFQLGVGFP